MKFHILNTDARFPDGIAMIADCGTTVRNAIWYSSWECDDTDFGVEHELEGAAEDKNLCRKCRRLNRLRTDKRYVVRLVNGQEAMSSEGTE